MKPVSTPLLVLLVPGFLSISDELRGQWLIDNLRDTTNQADYLIVSPPFYVATVEVLAAFRSTHNGFRVGIVVTDSVYNEFGNNVAPDSAIKLFIGYALTRWRRPSPEYLLFAGNINAVPSHLEPGINFPPIIYEDSVAIDQWFAEGVDDSSRRGYPALAIGRFPAWDVPQLTAMVSKTITYDSSNDSSWTTKIIAVADSGENFEARGSSLLVLLRSLWPETLSVHVRQGSPFHQDRYQFRETLNQGAALIQFLGITNWYRFSRTSYFTTWDIDSLANQSRLPFCLLHDQSMQQRDTLPIAVSLVAASNKGAVGVLAPTGITFFSEEWFFQRTLFEQVIQNPERSIGKSLLVTRRIVGSGIYDVHRKQTLFGDPAIVIKHSHITDVKHSPDPPLNATLHQNYPNPFNPETVIRFDISVTALVTLKVHNILGQEVAALVDEELTPGTYSTLFDAGRYNITSGVYYYRLTAGSFTQVRKMILLR